MVPPKELIVSPTNFLWGSSVDKNHAEANNTSSDEANHSYSIGRGKNDLGAFSEV
jgi:hypothetical protein